jgi:hypothetical protein
MVERFNGRISELCQQTRFKNRTELEQTLLNYLQAYNHFIPQRAIGYQSPIDALKSWYAQQPELFVKQVYKQAERDTGTVAVDSELERAMKRPFIGRWLAHFREYFLKGKYFATPRWDRVCVTTLFTFHWKVTALTIEFAKRIGREVFVGGILASVLPRELEEATGIKPHVGCLRLKNLPGDSPLEVMIDELPLDYSILDEIDYRYPADDAFYAYATRGCVNKCKFCAVPTLEPEYIEYIPIQSGIETAHGRFGERRNLMMLDNNVFASDRFDEIIDEIRDCGFAKDNTYIPPNHLDVAIRQLQSGWNDRAAIRRIVMLLNEFLEKQSGDTYNIMYSVLKNNALFYDYTASKENILAVYEELKDAYEKARVKKPLVRYVDFNQGLDSRLATDEKMAKLSKINIRPLRFAFDSWSLREPYAKAVCLAKKHGITNTSNYLLYNFTEEPVDLYRRMLLGVELSDVLEMDIYSFPMKYHPIADPKYFTNREYLGAKWSRKSIRTVQAVLNSTHGKVGRGKNFFFAAFGRSEEEFHELIQMPEAFIIKRWDAEYCQLADQWRQAYRALEAREKDAVDKVVADMKFAPDEWENLSAPARTVLELHTIKREDIREAPPEEKRKLIDDFAGTCPQEVSEACRALTRQD